MPKKRFLTSEKLLRNIIKKYDLPYKMTKEEIISTVDNTLTNLANTIPGVATLYQWLTEETDYFNAPASSKYHSNYEGGLVIHSWFVYQAFDRLFPDVAHERQTDIILICFLHGKWIRREVV